MTPRRLTAVDAQMLWLSAASPNDQFLLYGFGAPVDPTVALTAVRDNAARCAALTVRVRDRGPWRYPVWERCGVSADRFAVHDATTWADVLAAVAALTHHQVDAQARPWRLHAFPRVHGVPGVDVGSVAMLQISHALADGGRASALAARLFGRPGPLEAVRPLPVHGFVHRSAAAAVAHRRLVRDVDAGLVPPSAAPYPLQRSNTRPAGPVHLRTVVRRRDQLSRPTVTVGALSAISAALATHLRACGDDAERLGAEIPMAKPGERRANNHFGNVGIGLYPQLPSQLRTQAIARDLLRRRRRVSHPAMAAQDAAFAAVPAALLRWGMGQFDPDQRSPVVAGNTVVSSVNRGRADLSFGGAPVVLTAGFPALSPMMGVTHGVHGIGGTVAISVHAAESAIGDVDAYVERLAGGLG
ncbi:WS/DGAT domain-containing protein [Mycolicibacterium sp. 3033]|nr:WS/DGAT domain-containing protein [Mycolicibacterium aurantiacum]